MNSIKTAVAVSVFAVVMAGSVVGAKASPAYVPINDHATGDNVAIIGTNGTGYDLDKMAGMTISHQLELKEQQILIDQTVQVVSDHDTKITLLQGENADQWKAISSTNSLAGAARTGVQVNSDRLDILENAPKPKNGINGKDGAQGIAGANGSDGKDGINGKDGVTTTVTQLDAATQAKVAKNSQAITTTSGQAASVAQDLKDAKSFFSQQQASNNAQFKSLHDEVDSNKKEARSGAASAVAIASMPQVEAGQTVMFSAGVGSFKDEQAMSVGASFHAGVATVKAGISDSTNNDFAMGAGVGIGF
ncbi:YadA C-terminal domain-containing protein [Yokenella regensburgei]|uniref:YadA C-terminal domain-containing protein n=1 Tax=Yokenella regensburgei TaxID=158877 RepID=UPI001432C10A|nr:YadA C-terminal domain-containing protein [Yokenella regensburgei]QIU89632.1 hypothetical protein HEC60_10125 [Yokenella regensburgei]